MQSISEIMGKFDFSFLAEKIDDHSVNHADIIVGIPSYNEADNISYVVDQVNAGLLKYFPQYKSAIINVDNHSPDNTREAFLKSVNHIPKIYISTPESIKGKGNNFYNLFFEALRLEAKVVVVVDADLISLTPEWIRDLASPILKGEVDFVTPLYSRNEYDGTITNNICYPLLYGLLGKDIRQPIGGDFAFSAALARHYLSQPWHPTTRQYGIDIFMTLHAIMGGFTLGQVSLGAKIHKPSAPKLGPMFTQVVGTLFSTLLNNRHVWKNVKKVEKLPSFGEFNLTEPQSLGVDYKSLKAVALQEYSGKERALQNALSPELFKKIDSMFKSQKIRIGSHLWCQVVYDVLFAYYRSNHDPEFVEALKPLYFGRVITFIKHTLELDHFESEEQIKKQAQHFFRQRNYLKTKFGKY